MGKNKKQRKWRSPEIKVEIKLKKKKWREYLGLKTEESHIAYKIQKLKINNMIREAKKETWEEFEKKMKMEITNYSSEY